MGDKLSGEELLLRQVHPEFYQNGILGSRAFKPNSGDAGKMSTDRASLTSPQAAFDHYTQHMKKKSACVYGLKVEDFAAHSIECEADALDADGDIPANPAHSLADYNGNPEKSWKTTAQRLRDIADVGGCRYAPPPAA
ncbi:hypothetical protein FPV16_19200 [Methylobacterium sp. W2]|uniref:hypothetical protein n=1 Tax=Methylobacterium sp. W2 TaxID=2598107 RepID=UPI001D0CD47A|nr:hypothetical protein [Methylobacterium sp. W2]MCC0808310.1 hypothetical protein [Methylobacterium sp. W2]